MYNRKTAILTTTCLLLMVFVTVPQTALAQSVAQQGKATAIKWADEKAKHYSEMSRRIWEFKEMGLKEFKSSDLLVSELEANGFKVERGQAGMPTAFVATYVRGSGKPVIGVLAEYDALPNGHSCGHNLFGTGSVGAAIATKNVMEKHNIDGTIKLFGTPTEDTHGGKVWMAREHVFDGCDAMLIWHPDSKNQAILGSNLAVQILEVNYYGKSAHSGRAPEMGRSALDALTISSISLEFLREHMTEPMRIQYVISHGGQAVNVVPDYTQMKLAYRGPTMKSIEDLRKRDGGGDDCLRAGALGSGTDVKMQIVGAFYNRVPNKMGTFLIHENMKTIAPPTFTAEEEGLAQDYAKKHNIPLGKIDSKIYEPVEEIVKGSEDTGDVSYIVPLLKLVTTCSAVNSPLHSPVNVEQFGMSIGQKGMVYAIKVLAATAIDLLTDQARLAAINSEFKERIKDAGYKPVIPADLWPPIPDKNPPDFKGPAPQVRPKPQMPESMLYWKKK